MHRFVITGALAVAVLTALPGCSRDLDAERTTVSPPPADASGAQSTLTPAPAENKPPAVASGDPTIAKSVTAPAAAPAPAFREVTIPAGTQLRVRLDDAVSSKTSSVEDEVDATITAPVRVGESVVIPEGSEVHGDVVAADPAGKVKGRARVALRFRTLTVERESYPMVAQVSRMAPQTKKEDTEKIALPAVGGAIVGAIVGGKKGAAIGAAAGGGAGTAVVLATPGKDVSIPRGSILTLRLQQPVTVRVRA